MMLDIRQLAKGKKISEFDDLGWHDASLDEDEEVDIRRLRYRRADTHITLARPKSLPQPHSITRPGGHRIKKDLT